MKGKRKGGRGESGIGDYMIKTLQDRKGIKVQEIKVPERLH